MKIYLLTVQKRNGQLKPGYNIQIGVESEYIVGFGAFSNRTDVQTLIPFLERIKNSCGKTYRNIISKEGTKLRVNRSIQVEGVFGILKQDFRFKRFLMRGKRNVETQFFLLAFAFNVEKLCNKQKYGRIGQDLFPLKTG